MDRVLGVIIFVISLVFLGIVVSGITVAIVPITFYVLGILVGKLLLILFRTTSKVILISICFVISLLIYFSSMGEIFSLFEFLVELFYPRNLLNMGLEGIMFDFISNILFLSGSSFVVLISNRGSISKEVSKK